MHGSKPNTYIWNRKWIDSVLNYSRFLDSVQILYRDGNSYFKILLSYIRPPGDRSTNSIMISNSIPFVWVRSFTDNFTYSQFDFVSSSQYEDKQLMYPWIIVSILIGQFWMASKFPTVCNENLLPVTNHRKLQQCLYSFLIDV